MSSLESTNCVRIVTAGFHLSVFNYLISAYQAKSN